MLAAGSITQRFFDEETRGVNYDSLPDRLPPGRVKKGKRR